MAFYVVLPIPIALLTPLILGMKDRVSGAHLHDGKPCDS